MIDLSLRDIAAIEVYNQYNHASLTENNKELHSFMDVLMDLQKYIVDSKIKLPKYKVPIDTLVTKCILHCNSIYHMMKGVELKSESISLDANIFDFPTLYVVLRALLENYLMFDFIYVQPRTEEEVEFRNKNWMYAGFLSRKVFEPQTEKTKKVKESDKKQIAELKEFLQNSKFLMKYSQRQRKEIINKGKERLIYGWIEIMGMAKFNETMNLQMYRLLSSHAHSTGLSIVNIQEMKLGYHPQSDQGKMILFLTLMLISRMIFNFKSIIKTAEIRYNMISPNLTSRVEFYSNCLTAKLK